ncbi:hypothetical protein [Chromobacterium subtsugae]|uniref:hypothetical protein n=1 Tax=Chromobacterium subtsugae TaxID=251747 RepID=UPI0006411705|nr:hypothetical protein [Chromobacterium subtsugae]
MKINVGFKIVRKTLHNDHGGSRQGGISPSTQSKNVFIFSDLKAGAAHGYIMDGWKEDGLFHYTGEGQKGDQSFIKGNKAILNHVKDGRALRVFDGVRGTVTYMGEFELDVAQPYYYADAPETNNGPLRKVIVFRLRPVGDGATAQASPANTNVVDVPIEASNTETFNIKASDVPREAERRESGLVQRFMAFMKTQGITQAIRKKIIPPGEDSPLFCDIFFPEIGLLVEAKGSADRNAIRMAVGQLLDYRRHIPETKRSAILVPGKPSADLCDFATECRIEVYWAKSEADFDLLGTQDA